MNSTFAGNPDGGVTGICPAPPPPPPPPPVPGQVPAMRINTAEAPTIRRPQIVSNDGYEPPAAIQNAMLTKDKKPFTYTPGMGGKLDLSQIRSPRMARRVAKNANDEGIEGPPKSALELKPTPAQNAAPNLFIQPQVAVPVFPTNVPPQASNRIPSTPPANRTPPTPPANRTPTTPPLNKLPVNGTVAEKQPEPVKNTTKVETKVTPIVLSSVQPGSPEGPSTPTQVTLTKAPTPWLQNKNKPQEELPEWAKRASVTKQNSTSPDSPNSPPAFTPVQQAQQPQWQQVQQKQQPQQYQYQPPSPQQQQQQPQQFNQQPQKRVFAGPTVTQSIPQTQERVIPIRIEDRPSVFDVKHEPGHHQLKQPPSTHHQQRWGQAPVQSQVQAQQQQAPLLPQPQPSAGGAYIIPVMIENSEKRVSSGPGSNASYAQPTTRNSTIENQPVRIVPQRGPVQVQPAESGPVQSRSFRVLQKITDTDLQNDVDPEQLRKLQLSEDDRILMNKFKEQVDNDTFLHQEEDPRYRGAAIPSRAFRFLQTMTDAGESPVPTTNAVPRGQSAINKKQNRNSKSFEETQANLPPSEQQAPEPKKYMGSAIPSRSFRILQAMTAPETVATQENRQADYTCQTENNVPGNQQGVFMSPCPPPPFWAPDGGWWGYYPLPYPGAANDAKYNPYPYPQDGTAYIYYPIYNQNYTAYPPQCAPVTDGEKNAYANVYPQYVTPAPLQNNPSDQTGSAPCYGQISSDNGTGTTDSVMSMVKKIEGNKLQKETNNLSPPQWNENVSRAASSNSNKNSDCTTAMNITDEKEIPETIMIPKNPLESRKIENSEKPCASSALNLNVPNYTYIDVSDSSDSSDSESHSVNKSVVESSKSSSSCNAIDNTSSDSDDSDSYLAYSTGLNPHGRQDQNASRTTERADIEKESCMEKHELGSSSERINGTDCDSDLEEQIPNDVEKPRADPTYPHHLSVIYEDGERGDSENPRPQDNNKTTKCSEKPFEATDDPPDATDTTTVSVSLPLRFKFSVSENNEDVTTVIVGDSTIKPERRIDEGKQSQEQRIEEKMNDVSVDFQIVNDTTVDFTIKKQSTEDKRKTKSYTTDRTHDEAPESKIENEDDTDTPHVNFTLKKNPRRLSRINCEETIETEYTIRSKKVSTRKEEVRSEKDREEHSADSNTSINASERIAITTTKEVSNAESTFSSKVDKASHDVNRDKYEIHNFANGIVKPEVIVSECTWSDDSNKVPTENEPNEESNTTEGDQSQYETESEFLSKQKHNDDRHTDMGEKTDKEQKHLLSVQNSREETDDEDSGVTSDMSRIISEVDTDSECTSTRNIKKYQRTQTHSRLFRLLHDDSMVPEDTENNNSPSSRREYLSLPLKSNAFNYDENYCSNYSSGVTSPEYSPICEQSWKRLHDTENGPPEQNGDGTRSNQQERLPCKEDPYYQAWKTSRSPGSEQDVVPSLAFKILESRRPLWAYRVNVLCPRIKSTKSVPQVLRSRINESSSPVSSYVTVKTDRC